MSAIFNFLNQARIVNLKTSVTFLEICKIQSTKLPDFSSTEGHISSLKSGAWVVVQIGFILPNLASTQPALARLPAMQINILYNENKPFNLENNYKENFTACKIIFQGPGASNGSSERFYV